MEKATSEETVKSINLKNGDYLITVKYISADNKNVLEHSLPFSAKTDIRECLKSVHNRLCWYCDIDFWSKESNDIFMTFNYGIKEVLSNIAKSEAEEGKPLNFPKKTKGVKNDKRTHKRNAS